MKKFTLIFVSLLLIFPMVTFAAWWQPSTWSFWSIFNRQKIGTTTLDSNVKKVDKVTPVSIQKEKANNDGLKIENGINKIIKTIVPKKEASATVNKNSSALPVKVSETIKKEGATVIDDNDPCRTINEKYAYPPLQKRPGTILTNGDRTVNLPKRLLGSMGSGDANQFKCDSENIPVVIKMVKPAPGEVVVPGQPYEVQWTYGPGDLDQRLIIRVLDAYENQEVVIIKKNTDFNIRRDKNNPNLYKWTWAKPCYDDEGKLISEACLQSWPYRLTVDTLDLSSRGMSEVFTIEDPAFKATAERSSEAVKQAMEAQQRALNNQN